MTQPSEWTIELSVLQNGGKSYSFLPLHAIRPILTSIRSILVGHVDCFGGSIEGIQAPTTTPQAGNESIGSRFGC